MLRSFTDVWSKERVFRWRLIELRSLFKAFSITKAFVVAFTLIRKGVNGWSKLRTQDLGMLIISIYQRVNVSQVRMFTRATVNGLKSLWNVGQWNRKRKLNKLQFCKSRLQISTPRAHKMMSRFKRSLIIRNSCWHFLTVLIFKRWIWIKRRRLINKKAR